MIDYRGIAGAQECDFFEHAMQVMKRAVKLHKATAEEVYAAHVLLRRRLGEPSDLLLLGELSWREYQDLIFAAVLHRRATEGTLRKFGLYPRPQFFCPVVEQN